MRRRKSNKNRCSNSYCNHWHNSGDQRSRLGYGCLSKCTFGSSFAVDKCCRFAGNIRRIRIHKFSPSSTVLVFEGLLFCLTLEHMFDKIKLGV
nr:MAG TPA: hypothetical protein [Caudoviricetes sp.]